MNYVDTLIAVADDCPVTAGVVPHARAGTPSVALLQYQMLADQPSVYTQEDVLFESWLSRQDLPELSSGERERLRPEFFSRPQACLRASPLPKQYGWGLLFDSQGKVALCPVESDTYRAHLTGGTVKVLKAMRSRRV